MQGREIAALTSLLLLVGCATTYRLDGKTYASEREFQSASTALYDSTRSQVVAKMRLSSPLSSKGLTIGIPSLDTLKSSVRTTGRVADSTIENLAMSDRRGVEMYASIVRDLGIYQSVRIVDTTGGHLQPSPSETVLYVFLIPQKSAQWYINGSKAGLQTVNIDQGQPDLVGKVVSWVNSVKGYALIDQPDIAASTSVHGPDTANLARPALAPQKRVSQPQPAPATPPPPATRPQEAHVSGAPLANAPVPPPSVSVPVRQTRETSVQPANERSVSSALPLRDSRYMISAERYAKANGCVGPVATMNIKTATSETFTMTCSDGTAISIKCDPTCRELK